MKPPVRWIPESIPRGTDPLAGAKMVQLTSAADISHDIYGEQLYCSLDGSRIAFLRCFTTDFGYGPMEMWVSDLTNGRTTRLGPAVNFLVGGNCWRDMLYYIRRNDAGRECLTTVNLKTLERKDLFTFGKCAPPEFAGLLAVAADEHFAMILRRVSKTRYGLERLDLVHGTSESVHEHDDIFNAHLQFDPAGSGDLMVQLNRGGLLGDGYNVINSVGPEGATLYVLDRNGGNHRPLPVGKPHTPPVTGHECWLGKTGRVILTTSDGAIYLVTPGDKEPTLLTRQAGFNHITASADGRFFVVDHFASGRLHVGCLATKRLKPLCDTNTSSGSPQYTHTHPYITPDNRRVIFNSDRTGICQVYAALIPAGFLESLTKNE